MTALSVDRHFISGWNDRTTGSGVATVTGSTLKAGSNANGDSGLYDYCFGAPPGTIIKASVWARKLSGSVHPRISIDLFKTLGEFEILNYVEVVSSEWSLYQLTCTVPMGTTFPMGRLCLGSWSSQDGSTGEFKEPSIELINDYGSTRLLACGLIELENGVPRTHKDFKTLRIKSISISGQYMDVFVDVPLHTETSQDFPVFPIVTATTDNSKPITVHAGNIVPENGGTRIRFKFSQNGTFLNIPDISGSFHTFFKLEW